MIIILAQLVSPSGALTAELVFLYNSFNNIFGLLNQTILALNRMITQPFEATEHIQFSEKNNNFLKKIKALPFKVSFPQYYFSVTRGPPQISKK